MMYGVLDGDRVIAQFVAPLTLRSNVPVFASDTFSLRRVVRTRNAQRWELQANLQPLSSGAHELFALFVERGASRSFNIIVPQNYGVIQARSLRSQPVYATGSLDTIATVNAGFLPRGTMVSFSNHKKVYMLLDDLRGDASARVFPQLRVPVSNTQMFHGDDVRMPVKFDLDVVNGMMYTDGILMDAGSVRFLEDLSA